VTLYATGLFDEHEFDRQRPPHYGFAAYGPFVDIEDATAHARMLSSDPDEGVVIELETPARDRGEVAYIECLEAQEALYWEGRRRGWGLDDKMIGDLLRIAAPILAKQR
jgi:hypothetical protein